MSYFEIKQRLDKAGTTMALNFETIVPLVTGGGSGISVGLVKEFLKQGSPKVVIMGRRKDVLLKGMYV